MQKVSAVAGCLYLIIGELRENILLVLESSGEVVEFFVGKTVWNPDLVRLPQ